jgi:UDP-N-acetylmuramoyl-tripeptide--D-alanyl-D-alanine ligase
MNESLLTLDETLESTDGIFILGSGNFYFSSVQTDSRLVEKNSLFVPLLGEFQDGHKFIPQALENGAGVIFVRLKNFEDDGNFFVELSKKFPEANFIGVENTLYALQNAAARYVEKFPRLIKIGVTGSSGKTTTKEILYAILSQKFSTITNEGNLNSETGLPLSVFKIRPEHECGIFEMGMNRAGEIAEIAKVLKPRFAVVTNIGTAHVGKLGSRENIAKEKSQIFSHFGGFGTAVIPADDDFADFLSEQVEGKVVFFGGESEHISRVENLGLNGTKFFLDGKETVLPLPGKYNFKNALAAISMAQVLGLSAEEISAGIKNVKKLFGRGEILHAKNFTIIQDCYNANPDSMKKSMEFFSSLEKKSGAKKIFVLGDMKELGEDSKIRHEETGGILCTTDFDAAFFVGGEMKYAYEKASSLGAKNLFYTEKSGDAEFDDLAEKIKKFCGENESAIFVKGSRSMGLENLVKKLTEEKNG